MWLIPQLIRRYKLTFTVIASRQNSLVRKDVTVKACLHLRISWEETQIFLIPQLVNLRIIFANSF
jgi:hypothetical protein